MATSKTVQKKKPPKERSLYDRHFKLAFKKCSIAFKVMMKDIEKDPKLGKVKDFAAFRQALQGFTQSNVSKKKALRFPLKSIQTKTMN